MLLSFYRFACAEGRGANKEQSVLPAEMHGLTSEPYAEIGSRQKLRRFFMRDSAKHKSSILLSLRSPVKKWEPELERTACSHLAQSTWLPWLVKVALTMPQNSIFSTERGSLLGNASTHSNSKSPSVGFTHGEHLQVFLVGSFARN